VCKHVCLLSPPHSHITPFPALPDGTGFSGVDGPHLQLPLRWFGGHDFSICGWVNIQRFGYWSRIIDWGNGVPMDNIVIASVENTTTLAFEVYQQNARQRLAIPNFWDAANRTWAHFCVTASGSTTAATASAYLNGAFMGSTSSVNFWLPRPLRRTAMFVGRSIWNVDNYFNGYLDDLRVYSHALSPAEVTAVFQLR
jgi:hypothetical protein